MERRKVGTRFIDRETCRLEEEKVFAEGGMHFCYENNLGFALTKTLLARRCFGALYGLLQDTRWSAKRIAAFVQNLGIDMSEAEKGIGEYKTFNEFFTRRLRSESRPIDSDPWHAVFPADSRALVIKEIEGDTVFPVKGGRFRLADFLCDRELAERLRGGSLAIMRLCPADCHRFHFPDSGVPGVPRRIGGWLHSVNPIALKRNTDTFCRNKRVVTVFESDHFGRMLMVEVGAFCVGSIVETFRPGRRVAKCEEKGYFKFGGSTIVLVFEPGRITVDEDLVESSRRGHETRVKFGTRLGRAVGCHVDIANLQGMHSRCIPNPVAMY